MKTWVTKVIIKSYVNTFSVLKKTVKEIRYIIVSILLSGLSMSAYFMYGVVYASENLKISKEMWDSSPL